jgi:hypothetical protein
LTVTPTCEASDPDEVGLWAYLGEKAGRRNESSSAAKEEKE